MCVSRRRISASRAPNTSRSEIGRSRRTGRSRLKQSSLASALTSHGCPRVCVHTTSNAPGSKSLSRLGGVLAHQGPDIGPREVSQPQRLGLDVEGAASRDDLLLGVRPDPVVAHVAHPAQDDALRKRLRTVGVPGAQLTQDRHQRVSHHRVDFVDHQHQRAAGLCPLPE